jgi:hypothetical protein
MSYIYNLTDTWNSGATSFDGIKMAITNTASSTSYMLNLSVTGATTGSFTIDKSGALALNTSNFVVTSAGSVLVGTTSALASGDLEIRRSSTALNLDLYSANAAGNPKIRFYNNTNQGAIGYTSDQAIAFYNNNVTSERMRITAGGLVGIGTTNPQKLFVVSNANAVGMEWSPTDYAGHMRQLAYNRTTSAYVNLRTEAAQHEWYIGGSSAMTLDASGNLGLGVSPSSQLDMKGSGSRVRFITSGSAAYMEGLTPSGGGYADFQYDGNGHQWQIQSVEKMRLDASGNLGLGATPSAWSVYKAIQNGASSIASYQAQCEIWSNSYYDGANPRYVTTGNATRFNLNQSGAFTWNLAASGTAGNAISFTQAMTLSASGNLSAGTTTLDIGKIAAYQTSTDCSVAANVLDRSKAGITVAGSSGLNLLL